MTVLIANPIAVALGIIMMRSMRKTSEWTVTCWVNVTQLIFFTPFYYWSGQPYLSQLFQLSFGTFALIIL
ncbi:MAG: hypothetical protein ACK56F_15040 [bacterium]